MKQKSGSMFALAMLLAAGTLAFSGIAYSDEKEKSGKAEMAAAAKVTIAQAVKIASEKISGTIIEAELEKKHNKLVWEIEIVTAENKVMEVHIDADSGAVIDVEEERANPKKSQKRN